LSGEEKIGRGKRGIRGRVEEKEENVVAGR
jgi:hypothetical protein